MLWVSCLVPRLKGAKACSGSGALFREVLKISEYGSPFERSDRRSSFVPAATTPVSVRSRFPLIPRSMSEAYQGGVAPCPPIRLRPSEFCRGFPCLLSLRQGAGSSGGGESARKHLSGARPPRCQNHSSPAVNDVRR